MWTLSNGHCLSNVSLEKNPEDMTDYDEKCIFLLKLLLIRKHDEFFYYWNEKLISDCEGSYEADQKRIYYPRGHILTPYICSSNPIRLAEDEAITAQCLSHQKHRFNCLRDELTCLLPSAIGDGHNHCKEHQDETNEEKRLDLTKDYKCQRRHTSECKRLKNYIIESWQVATGENKRQQILFRQYCDSLWDFPMGYDEQSFLCRKWQCPKEYYQCESGQCIPTNWVLNRIWDCSDASDEIGVLTVIKQSKHNTALQLDISQKLFSLVLYSSISRFPLNLCHHLEEYGCILANVQNPLNFTLNHVCIAKSKIGDGQIDCYGGLDERNVLGCGGNINKQRGFDFHCHVEQCISYKHQCRERCWNGEDKLLCEEIPKFNQQECAKKPDDSPPIAYNETRCYGGIECKPFGLDEYYCDDSDNVPYRFHAWTKFSATILHLPIYPSTIVYNKKEWPLVFARKSFRDFQ
ncbi:unnamed protein product [Didymodactylos carnosus]|uniref:Uncharacterized protein n=1 Tax=Didymodactylos carnosus TaxID=1234261 RepID=A0A813ZPC2_9BILA|nr:unnamed protein product [Didymodactylos carnosus]CAF3684711.1 unnamed protein product [Didymodactylos carnosus]